MQSIESAIQWFQIHHGITFVTIHNPAVYLSGARVSISPTLVPRLKGSLKFNVIRRSLMPFGNLLRAFQQVHHAFVTLHSLQKNV